MKKCAYYRTHPRLCGVRLASHTDPSMPAGSLTPEQVLTACGFGKGCSSLVTAAMIGIVSLGGSYVASDLSAACEAAGIPVPNVLVLTAAGATQDPTDSSSNGENALDLQIAARAVYHQTDKPARLAICFGPNAPGGMAASVEALRKAGCRVISISWGGPDDAWAPGERAGLAAELAVCVANGVTVLAASGDNSADDGEGAPVADYPASDPNDWSVGGTTLVLAADGSVASEAAWGDGRPGDEGGGGGFDPSVSRPSWQSVPKGAPAGRGVPDSSANADPQTGYPIYQSGWQVFGGTSASTPLTASIVAVAIGAGSPGGLLTPRIYAQRSACRDITTGSNGYPSAAGWDPATGCGVPAGSAFVAALTASAPVAAPPVQSPDPSPAPGSQAPTEAQVLAWAQAALASCPALMFRGTAEAAVAAGIQRNWPASR